MDEGAPYHILGIRVGATHKEIRNAYRSLAMKYHPDRNPSDPDAEEQFKQVQRAYETLSGGDRPSESHQMPPYRWRFGDPFSDFSHPFFNFYMLAKRFFFDNQNKEPPSKKRGKGSKR
jgi:curved DNA-binding protein CbpA